MRNDTSKLLIWTQILPSWNASSNNSGLQLWLWIFSETPCCHPTPANGTRLVVSTMRRSSTVLQSPHQSKRLLSGELLEYIWHNLQNGGGNIVSDLKTVLQCRIESNKLSITDMRGLFKARFSIFCISSSDIGAATSNSEPYTSILDTPGTIGCVTDSTKGSIFEIQQPHDAIFLFHRRRITNLTEFNDWLAKNFYSNSYWWMSKTWKLTLWKIDVSATSSDTVFFRFLRKISESVNPSDSYPETPASTTPPTFWGKGNSSIGDGHINNWFSDRRGPTDVLKQVDAPFWRRPNKILKKVAVKSWI